MIKLLGCILIIGGCTIYGFIYSNSFIKRVIQLNELERAMIQLKNEIIYTYTTLPDALLNVSKTSIEPISSLLINVSELLSDNRTESVYEAFKYSIHNNEDKLFLKDTDIKVILDLAKNLGDSDIEGQNNIFELSIRNLKKQIIEAEELRSKNIKVYRYLGFGVGAIIVILIV